jgi:hypothetical protein
MANTFKKIQTVTVGAAGASSIDFTSIPQTFTDLKIVLSARCSGAAPFQQVYVRFNNNATGVYTNRRLYGYSNAAGSATATGQTSITINWTSGANATANVFGSGEIYIPNYTSSTAKSLSSDLISENNNATEAITGIGAGLSSATTAITEVNIIGESNFVQYTTATLYGVANVPASNSAYATGGNQIYTDGSYWYHIFRSDGTFTPTRSLTADYLVIAGGGAGGNGKGGGGGAGGLRCTVGATGGGGSLESALSLTATAYTVTVGAGGAGGGANTNKGVSGSNSVFSSITSTGGGGGGSNSNTTGANGGSGGGGSNAGLKGTGTANQGYDGANSGGVNVGSGGGGAGSAGVDFVINGGPGGNGVTTSISGTSTVYAGGGGGGVVTTQTIGSGTNGGGNGGNSASPTGGSGTTNTGSGGGGGGSTNGNGGSGGSGIVIVRYAA